MRTFSTLVQGVLKGAHIPTRLIARLYLSSATYYVSDGIDNITWNNGVTGAQVYIGFGPALSLQLSPSQTQNHTVGATLTLSGTDPGVLSTFFAETYRAQPCEIALLLCDPATGLPAEEVLLASGRCDVATITEGAQKATDPTQVVASTLQLTIAPHSIDLDRSGVRVACDVDQKLYRDSADGFFKDVAIVAKSTINWGLAGSGAPATVSPAGASFANNINVGQFSPPDLSRL